MTHNSNIYAYYVVHTQDLKAWDTNWTGEKKTRSFGFFHDGEVMVVSSKYLLNLRKIVLALCRLYFCIFGVKCTWKFGYRRLARPCSQLS